MQFALVLQPLACPHSASHSNKAHARVCACNSSISSKEMGFFKTYITYFNDFDDISLRSSLIPPPVYIQRDWNGLEIYFSLWEV